MEKNTKWIILLFIGICFFFFYPIFLGKIPFPGDLLINEYSPWKYFSFLGYIPGSFPEKFQYFDTLRQIYPWTTLVLSSIRLGMFPLWNPYSFSGAPLFANSQSAVLYPLHFLYFIFPQAIAWELLVMLQPLLTSIFTFLYARKIKLKKSSSIIAAIAFSYSLFSTVFVEYNTFGHVILFLPLLLFLSELLLERQRGWLILLFVASVASACFAGHLQLFGFVLLFVGSYVLARICSLPHKKNNFLFFGLLFLLGLGASAIQLLPTFELIQNAARVPQDYTFLIEKLLIQPYQLLLFFVPDLFGNPATKNYLLSDSYPGNALSISIAPFLLAFIALRGYARNWHIRFFSIAVIVLLLLFMRNPLSEIFYRVNIPFFSTGSPTNALFLLGFSLSILAGFGIEYLQKGKWILYVFIASLVLLFGGIIGLRLSHVAVSSKNILYSTSIYVVSMSLLGGMLFSKEKVKKIIIVCLIALIVGDLFYFFQKFNPFVVPSLIYPPTPVTSFLKSHTTTERFWSYEAASFEPNISAQFGLFDANGYDPLYPKWYGEFIQSSIDGKIRTVFTNQTRSDAVISQGSKGNFREKILNLLGVKYIVDRVENGATQETFSPQAFTQVYDKDGWKIYENRNRLPRAFLSYSVQSYKDDKEFGQLFFSDAFNPRETLLIKGVNYSSGGTGNVVMQQYSANRIVMKSQSTAKGFLFLSDTYFPGWKAYVDGKQAKIFQADYAFRAVEVPQGDHAITFVYQPSSFSLGFTLTIISIGLGIFFAFLVKRKIL